jgi:hypothetical protein
MSTKAGLFRIKVPGYSIVQARSPIFWRGVNPDIGAWHEPTSITRHNQTCFDVTFGSNSYGTRDPESNALST